MEKEPLFCNLYFYQSFGDNNEFERYHIRTRDKQSTLTGIYCNGICFCGAIALLKSEKYPNYSQIFNVYREHDEDKINITFRKCTDKDGREIFIKNDNGKFNDCIFCSFNVKKTIFDECTWGTITFFKNAGV